MSIRVSAVTKIYKGQKALSQVSFSADKGQIISMQRAIYVQMRRWTGYFCPVRICGHWM
jgi:hypothetical protein